jgi:hypothetical protein
MKYPKALDNLPFFNIQALRDYYPLLKKFSLYQTVKRLIDKKEFIQLKKGLYMTDVYLKSHQQDPYFLGFIANSLRFPSYISGTYVLQLYDLLTEATYTITSVTLKSSRIYNNKLGTFTYNSIKEDLYTGYTIEQFGENSVYIAKEVKAFFDFFYFKYFHVKEFPVDIKERDRISLEKFTKLEKKEFMKYCNLCSIKIFKKLPNLLFNE